MTRASRMSFQELLDELAAEHARVLEQNRTLRQPDDSEPQERDAVVNCGCFDATGATVTVTPVEARQQAMIRERTLQFYSAPQDDARQEAQTVAHNSDEFSSEGCKMWSDQISYAIRQDSNFKEYDDFEDRFALFNPFQSLNSLQVRATADAGGSFDSRIREISRRKAVLRSAGVTFADITSIAINPEHSRALERWDQVTMFSLCFVAIVCPIQISMLESKIDPLFMVNTIIDGVFFLDMILQFFVMYPKRTSYGTALEHRPKFIALNYLKSWFAIDLLSIVPFDAISIFSNQGGQMNRMKAVKVIRLLRLIKLMRILRASRLFRRFENRMPISYKHWALCRFFIMLCVITHWMANLWALTLVLVDEDENVPRWVDAFAELEQNVEPKTKDDTVKLYVAAMYFTSYTLTSLGYGDIYPMNFVERVVCIIMIVISGTSWAVVLGQVCGIVANMNADEQAFRKNMDELNMMMREAHFPADMCQRLRDFYHSNKLAQRRRRQQLNLDSMSSGLRGEVAIEMNRLWINKVDLLLNLLHQVGTTSFGRFIQAFIVDVCLTLHHEVHAQKEIFGKPRILYILIRGVVNRPPRLHLQGAVWGQDFVLQNRNLIEPSESFALTYVELTTCTRDEFFSIVMKYKTICPQLLRIVRRHCCWLALQRAIMKEAKRRQNLEKGPSRVPSRSSIGTKGPSEGGSKRFQWQSAES